MAMETIITEHGQCHYISKFLTQQQADELLQKCKGQLDWRQDPIFIYGKEYKIPRLHAWYGDFDYTYSKITLEKRVMPEFIKDLSTKISTEMEVSFNGVLANLYRDGRDSNGWHRDNEKELIKPLHIASISLGEERFFHLRKKGETKVSHKILLEHGSLLLMMDPFQDFWEHQIPKSKKVNGERINLTFRRGQS